MVGMYCEENLRIQKLEWQIVTWHSLLILLTSKETVLMYDMSLSVSVSVCLSLSDVPYSSQSVGVTEAAS